MLLCNFDKVNILKNSWLWFISVFWIVIVIGAYVVATVQFENDFLSLFGIFPSILSASSSNFSDFGSYFTGLIVAPIAAFFALKQWKESQASVEIQHQIALTELQNAEIKDIREAISNVRNTLWNMKSNQITINCTCGETVTTWGSIIHKHKLTDCCINSVRDQLVDDRLLLNNYLNIVDQVNEYGFLLCELSLTKLRDMLLMQDITDYSEMVRFLEMYDFSAQVNTKMAPVINVSKTRNQLVEHLIKLDMSHRNKEYLNLMVKHLTFHLKISKENIN